MATTQLFGGVFSVASEQTGGPVWRAAERELWNRLRRDTSDAVTQERRLYPTNWHRHVIRTVPFVWALARELAPAYVQDAGRRWMSLDGTPLPAATVALIEAEYKRANVNRVMRNAHRQLVALNNATIWVFPDARTGGVDLQLIPPHEQDVQMGSPFGRSEDTVAAWYFRVPVPVPGAAQMSSYAVAELLTEQPATATAAAVPASAKWVDGPASLNGRGLYETAGTGNPFGMLPVVILRGTEPGPGEWWAPCPFDILSSARAIDHDLTDVGTVARLQAFGQPVWKGAGPKDHEQQLGPETAVAVPPDGDFYFAQANAALNEYVQQNKEHASAVVAMNGLSPASFDKSYAITAVGKQMELIDREGYRKEHLEILRFAEQRLYNIIRAEVNWMRGGLDVFPEAIVEVEYREPLMPVDPLHDAQSLQMYIDMHQTDEVRARALRDGLSLEEAERRIIEEALSKIAREKLIADARRAAGLDAPVGQLGAPADPDDDEMDTQDRAADSPGAGPVALNATGEVQKQALNGAQIEALKGIIVDVAAGFLPTDSAREMIRSAFPIDDGVIDAMLGALDGFEPAQAQALVKSPVPA